MRIIFAVEDLFIIEPLGIMQMIAIAKKLGHHCYFTTYDKNRFMEFIKKEKPDVVAISIMSTSAESCRNIVNKIKDYDKDIFVIIGGSHPTYYPEFINICNADAICVGEGDYAFIDILSSLEKKDNFTNIPNIYTKNSINPPRYLVENLDELPFPDRDLVYKNTRLGRMKLKSFMATRGCPYSCAYCFNSGYKELYKGKGKILRRRSVDNLIDEIKSVKTDYPLEIIRFGDDVFIERMDDWFLEFTDKYRRLVGLPFYCLLSPKIITQEIAKRLKRAGCVSVATSIETGNQRIRYEILQRKISDQEIIDACRILSANGIKTLSNIMVGLPESAIEDELKSLDLAFKGRVTYTSVTIFTPFPGTALYKQCVQKKMIPDSSKPIFPVSMFHSSMLSCFSEKEKNIQKNIMLLGALANGCKPLRKPILKYFIYLPPNRIFFYIAFIVRNYYHYLHIWPMTLSIREFFRYVGLVFCHDKKYVK